MEKYKTIGLLSFVALAAVSSLIGRLRYQKNSPPVSSQNEPETDSFSKRCTWANDQGTGEAFLRQGNIYVIYDSQGSKQYYLMKENCIWSWQEKFSTGTKICNQDLSNLQNTSYNLLDEEGNKNDLNCQTEEFSDSLFLPPSEITFTEQSALAN